MNPADTPATATPVRPSAPARRRRAAVPLVGVCVAVAVLAGCSGSTPSHPVASSAPPGPSSVPVGRSSTPPGTPATVAPGTPTTPAAPTTAATHPTGGLPTDRRGSGDVAAQVRAALLTPPVLAAAGLTGYTVTAEPGGTSLSEPTFAGCGAAFPSEAHRTVRDQTELFANGTDTGASQEVVGYDSPADAASALAEWRAAVADCSKDPVTIPGTAGKGVFAILDESSDTGTLPAADNVSTTLSVTVTGDPVEYAVFDLQRSGAVVSNVYLTTAAPPTSQDTAQAATIAAAAGKLLPVG